MNRRLTTLLMILISIGINSVSAQPLRVDDEFMLVVPAGWLMEDRATGYPFHLTDLEQTAEIYIFRSSVTAEETIDDEHSLRLSVEAVIEGVLPEMASPELKRSSGYLDGDNASFIIDFVSADSASGMKIYHRMKGVLYRLPDQTQALFTLWAKSSPDDFPYHEPAIDAILESFEYIGERKGDVFAADYSRVLWYLVFAVIGLAAITIYINRRLQQRSTVRFADNTDSWRCTCGRLNHHRRAICRRCGYSHVPV